MPDNTPHVPTDVSKAEVAALLSFGNTQKQICEYLGITDKTLSKHYKYEIRTAVIRANAKIAQLLYNKCILGEELKAQIFWLKTRARWRTVDHDVDQQTTIDNLDKNVAINKKDLKDAEKEF